MTPEALFELFLLSPIGFVEVDEDGKVEVANPAARQLLAGFSRDWSVSDLFSALGSAAPDLSTRARTFDAPRGLVIDNLELLAPGAQRGLTLSLIKVMENRFVAIVADASSLATSRGFVTRLEQQLQAIDGAVREYATFTVDVNGKIDSWSASAARVHQWSANDAVGQSLAMLAPNSTSGESHVQQTLTLAARNGWCEEEGQRVRRDATIFWASTIVTALRAQDGSATGFVVVTHDLSERKKMEQSLTEEQASSTDYLTGVATRRGFFEVAGTEIARARRYGHPLSMLLVDPDRLRELNEQHGTEFGDECLRALAWVCRQESRTTDVVGRVGGEEFAVLLPATELSGGLVLAERIRERMARHVFAGDARDVTCTVCVGVVELSEEAPSVDGMLALGDTAVQRAKQAGRNLVVGYDA
jgi:diguanylate cyclase (GGDEF)-like protein/PAS domain S-box-containing protein